MSVPVRIPVILRGFNVGSIELSAEDFDHFKKWTDKQRYEFAQRLLPNGFPALGAVVKVALPQEICLTLDPDWQRPKANANHPLQPIITDEHGVKRFKANSIVRHLLDFGGIDLNQLARMYFEQNDREQFAQLIGYSLSGFAELSYVSDQTLAAVEAAAKGDGKP